MGNLFAKNDRSKTHKNTSVQSTIGTLFKPGVVNAPTMKTTSYGISQFFKPNGSNNLRHATGKYLNNMRKLNHNKLHTRRDEGEGPRAISNSEMEKSWLNLIKWGGRRRKTLRRKRV